MVPFRFNWNGTSERIFIAQGLHKRKDLVYYECTEWKARRKKKKWAKRILNCSRRRMKAKRLPSRRTSSGQNVGFCVEMVKRGLGWGIVPEIGLAGFDGCVRPCLFENGEPFVRKTYLMCQKEVLALP